MATCSVGLSAELVGSVSGGRVILLETCGVCEVSTGVELLGADDPGLPDVGLDAGFCAADTGCCSGCAGVVSAALVVVVAADRLAVCGLAEELSGSVDILAFFLQHKNEGQCE